MQTQREGHITPQKGTALTQNIIDAAKSNLTAMANLPLAPPQTSGNGGISDGAKMQLNIHSFEKAVNKLPVKRLSDVILEKD